MIKPIVVDDERIALESLAKKLARIDGVEAPELFETAAEACSFLEENVADIAFLDISLRDSDGLELAERVRELCPGCAIVFVTGYADYAVDAFRIDADGYVRQARVDEFDQVMDFYTKMIDEMRDTDFDVCWEHGVHPSPAFLRASVDAGEAYVGLVDGRGRCGRGPRAAHRVGHGAERRRRCRLRTRSWHVTAAPDEVLVVHVLGTLPAYHGRGFARAMVEACIDVARAAGKRAVRLDTFTTNVRAQSLYESCGFVNCGVCEGFYDLLGLSAVMYEYAV